MPVDMVLVDQASSDVAIEDCHLLGIADAASWGATEWVDSAKLQACRASLVLAQRKTRTGAAVGKPDAGP